MVDVFMGGEKDPSETVLPKHYEYFFNLKDLSLVLVILSVLLLAAGANI